MQLGAEAVFVGSGIFMQDSTTFAKPEEAAKRARAIVPPRIIRTIKYYLKSAKTCKAP